MKFFKSLAILSLILSAPVHADKIEFGIGRTIPQNGSTAVAGHIDYVTDKNWVAGVGHYGRFRIYQRYLGVNAPGARIPEHFYVHAGKRFQYKILYAQLGLAWVSETSNTVSTPFQIYTGGGFQWNWTEHWGGALDFRHLSNGGGFFGILESGDTDNEGEEYVSLILRYDF